MPGVGVIRILRVIELTDARVMCAWPGFAAVAAGAVFAGIEVLGLELVQDMTKMLNRQLASRAS